MRSKFLSMLLLCTTIHVASNAQSANEYYKGLWRGFSHYADYFNYGNLDNDDYAQLATTMEPIEDSVLTLTTNNNRYNYAYLKTIKGQEYLIVEMKKRFRSNYYQTYKIIRKSGNQIEVYPMISYTKKMRINSLNDMYYYIVNNGKKNIYDKPNTLKRVSTTSQYDCVDCYH